MIYIIRSINCMFDKRELFIFSFFQYTEENQLFPLHNVDLKIFVAHLDKTLKILIQFYNIYFLPVGYWVHNT